MNHFNVLIGLSKPQDMTLSAQPAVPVRSQRCRILVTGIAYTSHLCERLDGLWALKGSSNGLCWKAGPCTRPTPGRMSNLSLGYLIRNMHCIAHARQHAEGAAEILLGNCLRSWTSAYTV